MRPARCLCSPSRALRSVFLPAQLDMAATTTAWAAAANSSTRLPTYLLSPRLFSTSSPQLYIPKRAKPAFSPGGGGGGGGSKKAGGNLPRDNAIPYRWIRIAECEAHGMRPENPNSNLSAPVLARDILRGLDRAQYTLEMVALPPSQQRKQRSNEEGQEEGIEEEPEAQTLDELEDREMRDSPVCRIVDKQRHKREAEARAKEARKKELNRKELELNWAIAPNDLQHRLKQLRGFLEKGRRVELMVAKKRGGRVATADEARLLMDALSETATEVGATEVKREGKFPGVARIIYEGKRPKGS
ncbi:hypothetical protein BJ166DRAFT_519665 [Pestalotiopsis sp. NC0098]|nr:hypothetical protein BJ166DRAFT_519665 [Pestalotiopsis sp. NC0098]